MSHFLAFVLGLVVGVVATIGVMIALQSDAADEVASPPFIDQNGEG